MSRGKIHKTWGGMLDRCYNPQNRSYKNYGRRGIEVCERWADKTQVPQNSRGRPSAQGFLNFLEDMEAPWFPGATIDRVDNDGDYTPDNCRWVTRSDNVKEMNRRRVSDGTHHLLDSNGASQSNLKRVANGTHPFLNGITCFDTELKKFRRVSKEEYRQASNDRYYATNSKYVRTMKLGGAL